MNVNSKGSAKSSGFERVSCEDRSFGFERPEGREVEKTQNQERDDENDSRLFEAIQDYILEHYPNPQRVGCLGDETLRRLVETPEQLDLGASKYLHVFKCAECTRELRDLRRQRETRIQRTASSPAPSKISLRQRRTQDDES